MPSSEQKQKGACGLGAKNLGRPWAARHKAGPYGLFRCWLPALAGMEKNAALGDGGLECWQSFRTHRATKLQNELL